MSFPLKIEETLRDVIFKNKLNCFTEKCPENYIYKLLIKLLKETKFNDISDLIRTFHKNQDYFRNPIFVFENLSFFQNYIFHFPIIVSFDYFLENSLGNFNSMENYSIVLKSLHSLLICKKKYSSIDFFSKKISAENFKFKQNPTVVIIINHENLFSRGNFSGFQSYLKWFCFSLEKYSTYNYSRGKISFSLGKLALIENKTVKAFSCFLEAFEEFDKNDFKVKIIIADCLIFSSIFLKNLNLTVKRLGKLISFRSKNLFKVKKLYSSIKKNNLISLEALIFKSKTSQVISGSFLLLIKTFFKNIKKKLKIILSILVRVSMHYFSIILGISRGNVETILSYNTLKGYQKGYFNSNTDTFNSLVKIKVQPCTKLFLDTSVNLGNYLGLYLKKKY